MVTTKEPECLNCDRLQVEVDNLQASVTVLGVFLAFAFISFIGLAIYIFRQQILKLVQLIRHKGAKPEPSTTNVSTRSGYLEPYSGINPDKKIDHLYRPLDKGNETRPSERNPKHTKEAGKVNESVEDAYIDMDNGKGK